jgi:hypothetical protein
MSEFRQNLLRARSHIVFILALLAATAVIVALEARETHDADPLAAPLIQDRDPS